MIPIDHLQKLKERNPMLISELLFSFRGRIGRSVFWYCYISLAISSYIVRSMLYSMVGQFWGVLVIVLAIVFVVFHIWISLAVYCKRWHDLNKSGWWSLINLIPIVGQIWLFIELGFLKGTPGQNRFGEDPDPESESDFDIDDFREQ